MITIFWANHMVLFGKIGDSRTISSLYRVSVLYKKKKKKNTYLAFLDLSKAFDRV